MAKIVAPGAPRTYVRSGEWPDGGIDYRPAVVVSRLAQALQGAMGGRSLRRVAEAAGTTHSTLLNIIAGERWPSVVTIAKLEATLDRPLWPSFLADSKLIGLVHQYADWLEIGSVSQVHYQRQPSPVPAYLFHSERLGGPDVIGILLAAVFGNSRAYELAARALDFGLLTRTNGAARLEHDFPVAVLGPLKPDPEALELMARFHVAAVWPTDDGFSDSADGFLTARRRFPQRGELPIPSLPLDPDPADKGWPPTHESAPEPREP